MYLGSALANGHDEGLVAARAQASGEPLGAHPVRERSQPQRAPGENGRVAVAREARAGGKRDPPLPVGTELDRVVTARRRRVDVVDRLLVVALGGGMLLELGRDG